MSNVPMTLPQLMLAEHNTPFFHSSFLELDDSRILHVGVGMSNYSQEGGLTWSKAEQMQDINGNQVGASETSLVKLSDKGAIGLAARITCEPGVRGDAAWPLPPRDRYMAFWRSDDTGQTWQPPVRISAPGTRTAGYHDNFLRTSSGRIVLPVYHMLGQKSNLNDGPPPMCGKLVCNQFVPTSAHFCDPSLECVYVLYSDDDGRTWQRNEDGELVILMDWNGLYSYCNECSATEVAPGRLLLMMRNGLGRLFQAWSNDNGQTWSRPQPTSLAASTGPPQVRTLPNGHLLCVWSQDSEEEIMRGYGRTRLSSAISRNGGSVWEFFQNVHSLHEATRVEPGPIRLVRPAETYFPAGLPATERPAEHILSVDEHTRWSYPSVLVMKDRVIIAHTYSRFEPHPTRAELVRRGVADNNSIRQKQKVLPLKWFYGGKEPANNPYPPRGVRAGETITVVMGGQSDFNALGLRQKMIERDSRRFEKPKITLTPTST